MRSVIDLVRFLKAQEGYYREIMLMMENNIVPNIDQLQLRDLYFVLKALKLHRIGKQIYYDLLATEYVRKY